MVTVLITVLLSACSNSSSFKDLVRDRLNDPDSAKFKDDSVASNGLRGCILWNAKNRMGGYGEWQIAEFKKLDGTWIVVTLDGLEENCTEIGFQAIDAHEKARADSFLKAIEILNSAKSMAGRDALHIGTKGSCRHVVSEYVAASALLAERRIRKDEDGIAIFGEHVRKAEAVLITGFCPPN